MIICYKDFLCELQHHDDDNILNADTENPTEEDNEISAVEDLESRTEFRWIRYLQSLQEGAWGDHLAVQVLASMLNVSIVIISTLNPNMQPVEPANGRSIGRIYLGLIDQFHYVALTKNTLQRDEVITTKAANDDLQYKERTEDEADFEDKERAEDEADFEDNERAEDEADLVDKEREEDEAAFEHACKIKGAPFETSLVPENPELGRNIYILLLPEKVRNPYPY